MHDPWWEAVELRTEITNASGQIEDVQMALGAAVNPGAGVPRPGVCRPVALRPDHPSDQPVDCPVGRYRDPPGRWS